jgi:hypothetical protein
MTPADAFSLACTPSLVGLPLATDALLALVRPGAPAELAAKLRFHEQAILVLAHRAGARLGDVERGLRAHGLAVPPRPTDARSFGTWRDAVVAAVLAACGPATPASAVALLGVHAGDAILFANLLATALSLATAAPAHGALLGQIAGCRAQLEAARARLELLVGAPQVGPAVTKIGGEIVALLPAVRDERDAAVAREHAGKLETLRLAVDAALALARSGTN